MDTDRSQAYGRVVKTLDDMGPTKLQTAELQTIRAAADALFFDGDAREQMAAVEALAQDLIESDRWSAERVDQLVDDVASCGPPVGVR